MGAGLPRCVLFRRHCCSYVPLLSFLVVYSQRTTSSLRTSQRSIRLVPYWLLGCRAGAREKTRASINLRRTPYRESALFRLHTKGLLRQAETRDSSQTRETQRQQRYELCTQSYGTKINLVGDQTVLLFRQQGLNSAAACTSTSELRVLRCPLVSFCFPILLSSSLQNACRDQLLDLRPHVRILKSLRVSIAEYGRNRKEGKTLAEVFHDANVPPELRVQTGLDRYAKKAKQTEFDCRPHAKKTCTVQPQTAQP